MWEKLNLVTQPKGDQLQCTHCGYKQWHQGLSRPTRCPKCKCSDFERHPSTHTVYGVWTAKPLGKRCPHCRGRLELVPLEGHPNSRFWGLKQNEGSLLWACKNLCPEEGTNGG